MNARGSLARAALVLLVMSLLGGCIVLTSKVPLIAQSDIPDERFAGSYQVMRAATEAEYRKVPQPYRDACLDPGYTQQIRDEHGEKTGKRQKLHYCGYDVDEEKPLDKARLEPIANGFRWTGEEDKSSTLVLKRLHAGLYLGQWDISETDQPIFLYTLFRPRPPGLELLLLLCDDFPSIAEPFESAVNATDPDAPADSATDDAGDPGKTPKQCSATSLESISPELDAVVARVDAGLDPPAAILSRIGD